MKDLWYHVRLLEDAAPSVLRPLRDTLHDLEDALGDDHDVTTLLTTVGTDAGRRLRDAAGAHAPRRSGPGRPAIGRVRVAERVYAEKPKAFRRRIGRYLAVWYDDGPELPVGPIEDVVAARESPELGPLRVPAGVGY